MCLRAHVMELAGSLMFVCVGGGGELPLRYFGHTEGKLSSSARQQHLCNDKFDFLYAV